MMLALLLLACQPLPEGDASGGPDIVGNDTGWSTGDDGGDDGGTGSDDGGDDGGSDDDQGCVPDSDPAISAAELPFDPDVVAHFLGATTTIDPDADWDYRGVGAEPLSMGWHSPAEFWFADRFPTATHVVARDLDEDEWVVYRAEADGMWMLGVASATPNDTALEYAPAIRLWEFPIAAGDGWETETTATGLYQGETYPRDLGWGNEVNLLNHADVRVDGSGDVRVDAGTYEAQRISIALTGVAVDDYGIEYGSTSAETWLYLSPCAGMVARLTETEFIGLGL